MRAAKVLVVLVVLLGPAVAVPHPGYSRLLKAAQRLEEERVDVLFWEDGMPLCDTIPANTKCCNIAGSSLAKASVVGIDGVSTWKGVYESQCSGHARINNCGGGCTSNGWLYRCPMKDPARLRQQPPVVAQHDEPACVGAHVYCQGPDGQVRPYIVPLSSKLNAGKSYNCEARVTDQNGEESIVQVSRGMLVGEESAEEFFPESDSCESGGGDESGDSESGGSESGDSESGGSESGGSEIGGSESGGSEIDVGGAMDIDDPYQNVNIDFDLGGFTTFVAVTGYRLSRDETFRD